MVAGTGLIAQDQQAQKILNDVSRTYKSYKTIKAKFKINILSKQGQGTFSQAGTLYLKGKKFRITMADQEIYCDGKLLWTYFKEENEVQITKYDPKDQEIKPIRNIYHLPTGFSVQVYR